MDHKRHSLYQSFNCAISGIIAAVKLERNLKIHLMLAVLALVLGVILDLSRIEYVILFLTITLVISLELVNTAIEKTIDVVTQKYHPLARLAKDIAAGAVFIAAINAVVVGWFIFGQKLVDVAREPLRSSFIVHPVELTVVGIFAAFILVIFFKGVTNAKKPLTGGWPSGHAAIAFAMATAVAFYVESALIIVLGFALAILVAQSRVEGSIHTVPEVIAGAALGTLIMALVLLVSLIWTI
ncbi:MAG: diacylglycerol kinase [Firmicutes bacterium]|nr:diacylglycerol kinase [Bacillota bacterium]MDD4263867.1 diacylglycerol kinase [Bacillota bacterium]MDD4692950.1 diacylglycerol kinase [Bacillota bacterium]